MSDTGDVVDAADDLVEELASGGGSNPRAVVRRIYLEGGEVVKELDKEVPASEFQTIDVRKYVSPPARVLYVQSATINMGNYESVKSIVGVSLPCYPAELDECYEFADEWVSERMAEEIDEARASSSKGRRGR